MMKIINIKLLNMRTFLSTLALVLGFWCVVSAQTTLPAPTFSPESGTYAEATKVTITCEGARYIYYTTNGTEPSQDNGTYCDPGGTCTRQTGTTT